MNILDTFEISYIQKLYNSCTSRSEILSKLGMCTSGNNYKTLDKYVNQNNIDTSWFDKNKKRNQTMFHGNKPDLKCVIENNFPYKGHSLKYWLINNGYKKHRCECCKREEWNGKKIPLELHHKDGNHNNNFLSNLQLLCPNCHSMTDNYGRRNMKVN